MASAVQVEAGEVSPGPSGGSSPLQALCLEGTTATRELLEVTPPPLPLPLAQERSWDVSSESVFFPLHCPTPSWGGGMFKNDNVKVGVSSGALPETL